MATNGEVAVEVPAKHEQLDEKPAEAIITEEKPQDASVEGNTEETTQKTENSVNSETAKDETKPDTDDKQKSETPKKKDKSKSIVSRIFSFKCLQPARDEDGEPVRLRAPSKRSKKKDKKSKIEDTDDKEEKKEENGELAAKTEEKKEAETEEEKPEDTEPEDAHTDEIHIEKVEMEFSQTVEAAPQTLLAQVETKEVQRPPSKSDIETQIITEKADEKAESKPVIKESDKKSEEKPKKEKKEEPKLEDKKSESKDEKADKVTPITVVKNVAANTASEKRQNFLVKFREENKIHAVDFMKIWKNYDKDNTGFIDSSELKRFLVDLMKEKGESTEKSKVESYYHVMMEIFDKNDDDKLDIDELSHLLPVEKNYLKQFSCKKIPTEEFDNIFQHYDKNGDGTVAGLELLALLKDMFQHQGQEINAKDLEEYAKVIMQIYDIGEDGKLTKSDVALLLGKSQSK